MREAERAKQSTDSTMTPPEAHPLLPDHVFLQSRVPLRPVGQSESHLLCLATINLVNVLKKIGCHDGTA